MKLDNEDDTFEIKESQDGDEAIEKKVITSLIKSRKRLQMMN